MTSNSPAAPDPSSAAYFLDFDGTLVDIAPTPDSIQIPPDLAETLRRLRTLCNDAVAIVTGRPIAQVETFLPNAAYAIAGEHGAALRLSPTSPITAPNLPSIPPTWLSAAKHLAQSTPGALFEPKTHGFALHYRAAPQAGPALQAALQSLLAQSPNTHQLLAAKMAWEIRPTGIDKGAALRTLMQHPPFTNRLPIYIGDDITDEDGIAAARALGGTGLRLPDHFANPAALRAWLWALTETPAG